MTDLAPSPQPRPISPRANLHALAPSPRPIGRGRGAKHSGDPNETNPRGELHDHHGGHPMPHNPEPDGGTRHVPGPRVCDARVRSVVDADRVVARWPRRGPLPAHLRELLAQGFGARLRELRRERGWTQRQLADAMRWTDKTVRRYEHGERRPTADVVMRLAGHLATPERDCPSIALEFGRLVGRNIRSGGREKAGYRPDADVAEEAEKELRRRIEAIRGARRRGS